MAREALQKTFDGYIRVSRVAGRSGDSYRSPADQRDVIERLALAHGLTLGEVVVEEDVSGSKKTTQRELGRLVQKVLDGESGGIVVWKVSRFSRSLVDGVTQVGAITDAGGRVIGEDLDTGAPMGKALLGLMLGLAEEELDARREGWRRATEGAIARGVYIGTTPVGYDKQPDQKLKQNADAPAVRAVFLARARGRSQNDMAADLEAAGVEPVRYREAREGIDAARAKPDNEKVVTRMEKTLAAGPRWHKSGVRSMLSNPIYKGSLSNGHEHHFPEYAIVTPGEWAAAQPAKGKGNLEHAPRGAWAILGGSVFCGGCGRAMSPSATKKYEQTYRYYKCQNRSCTSRASVNATQLDAYVSASALAFYTAACEQGVVVIGKDRDVEEITALEQDIVVAKARLRSARATADLTDPEDAAEIDGLAAAVEDAKGALTDAQGKSALKLTPAQWQARWDGWDVEEKRAQLRTVLSDVTVTRGAEITVALEDMEQELEGGTAALLATGILDGVPIEQDGGSVAPGVKIHYRLGGKAT